MSWFRAKVQLGEERNAELRTALGIIQEYLTYLKWKK